MLFKLLAKFFAAPFSTGMLAVAAAANFAALSLPVSLALAGVWFGVVVTANGVAFGVTAQLRDLERTRRDQGQA